MRFVRNAVYMIFCNIPILILVAPITLKFQSCKNQNRTNDKFITVNNLIGCIQKKDTSCVINMLGSGLKNGGKSPELIGEDFKRINELLGKYGIPNERSYIVVEDKTDKWVRTIVSIPVFNGRDSVTNLLNARIEVSFAPIEIMPSSKIFTYQLIEQFDQTKFKIKKSPFKFPENNESAGK